MMRGQTLTPEGVAAAERNRDMIEALLARQVGQTPQIGSDWQGLAHIGGALVTALLARKAGQKVDQAKEQYSQAANDTWAKAREAQAAGGSDAMIDVLAANPATRDDARQMMLEGYKQQFKEPPITWGAPERIEGAPGLYQRSNRGEVKEVYQTPDWLNPQWVETQKAIRAAGRNNVSVNVDARAQGKGLEKAYELGAQAWDAAREAGVRADRDEPLLSGVEEALDGFKTGATADMRLRGSQILNDLGLNVEGVPEGEMFKMLSNRLQLAAAPKGQGQITEYERSLIAQTVPTIGTSVEGNRRIVGMIRKLNEFDRKAAAIYRESARKNGGVPHPVEVSEALTQLGPPLNAKDMSLLQGGKSAQARQSASPPAAVSSQSDTPAPPPGFVVR